MYMARNNLSITIYKGGAQMTRKHYEIIAETIRRSVDVPDQPHAAKTLDATFFVEQLSSELKRENARFNSERFRDACGLDPK